MSSPISHILLPTDLNRDVWPALQLAFQLGQEPRTRLTFLHVVRGADLVPHKHGLDALENLHAALHLPPDVTRCVPTFTRNWDGELRTMVHRLRRKIHPEWSDRFEIQTAWRRGDVAREILNYARESQVDTIVLNAKPRTGWRRWMPTLSEQVLRQADCRVVLVLYPQLPPDCAESPLRPVDPFGASPPHGPDQEFSGEPT